MLPRDKVSTFTKVSYSKGKTGIATGPTGVDWGVSIGDKVRNFRENELSVAAANYEAFYPPWRFFPRGKKVPPSGYPHTLIFDPDSGGSDL